MPQQEPTTAQMRKNKVIPVARMVTDNEDDFPCITDHDNDAVRCKLSWGILGKEFLKIVLLALVVYPFFILFQRTGEMQDQLKEQQSISGRQMRVLESLTKDSNGTSQGSARASAASATGELQQHWQAIEADALSIKVAQSAMADDLLEAKLQLARNITGLDARIAAKHAAMESAMAGDLLKLENNITVLDARIAAKRAAGECKNPVPGAIEAGSFISPRSLARGRSAIKQSCHEPRTFTPNYGDDEKTYDVPDAIDKVTHHAETDATATVQAFSTLDQKKREIKSSSGWKVAIGSLLSLGSSTMAQKQGHKPSHTIRLTEIIHAFQMSGFFTSSSSRLYEVRRSFGAFDFILKGDLEPYLVPEVKDALSALPRNYSEETKQAYEEFFEHRYGPFFIDQVYNGGEIKASVTLSEGASMEAENSASAMHSGIKVSVGQWAAGFGSGDGGGDSSLSMVIREKSSSEIQVTGGDHADPLALAVLNWTDEEFTQWMQSVRRSPKMIHYRVRSTAELTNDPALKEAIRAAISDIYGSALDDAEQYEELIHNYNTVLEQEEANGASLDTLKRNLEGLYSTQYDTGACNERTWPDVDHGLICGECTVLVNRFNSHYKTCTGYCSSIGRLCTNAWEERDDNCLVKYAMSCGQTISSSDAICECKHTPGQSRYGP